MEPPGRRLPSLGALAAFEALVRRASIRDAADDLAVTPQAVSQQVKALEHQLGVRLVRYAGRRWHLTAAGEAGAEALRDGFADLRRAVARMRDTTQRPRLTVSVDPALAATWLVPRLARFHAAHPGLEVLLEASMREADVAAGEADVALRYGRGDYRGLRAERLFDDRVFPVCSPALAAGAPPLHEPTDLRRHVLIHLDWRPAAGHWPGWRDWLVAAGVDGVAIARGPRFSDHALALQAAAAGQGVALASRPLADDALAAGTLVRPFDTDLETGFGYDAVCAPGETPAPVAAFLEWLRAEAGSGSIGGAQ